MGVRTVGLTYKESYQAVRTQAVRTVRSEWWRRLRNRWLGPKFIGFEPRIRWYEWLACATPWTYERYVRPRHALIIEWW